MIDGIEKKNKEIKHFFNEAREGAIETVNQAFDDLEQSFNLHFENLKETTGLLNEGRLRQIQATLNKQGADITVIQQELHSQEFSKAVGAVNS
jgi:hypothetical protein